MRWPPFPFLRKLMGVVTCAVVVIAFVPIAVAGTATIDRSPAVGLPGTWIAVSGAGFVPSEAIDLYWDGSDVTLAVAGSAGGFSDARIQAPPGSGPGTHWISAVGRRSGASAQRPFTVRANWTQYRYGAGRAGFNPYEDVLGPSSVFRLAPAWSTSLGKGWRWVVLGSPAVVGGTVYVAPAGSFGDQGALYALDARTGSIRWRTDVAGSVLSSPAVANGLVYVNTSYPFELVALHPSSGAVAWRRTTIPDLDFEGENFQGGSPLVLGDTVYVAVAATYSDGGALHTYQRLFAFDATTGATRWVRRIAAGDPAAGGGLVFVASHDAGVSALSASTGATVWTRPTDPDGFVACTGGSVFVSSEGRVVAYRASDGAVSWNTRTWGAVQSRAAVADGIVYVSSELRGKVYALRASTGAILWKANVTHPAGQVVANGVVHTGSDVGTVYALKATTGARLWSAAVGTTKEGVPAAAAPVVVNGTLLVGANDGIHAFAPDGVVPAGRARPDPEVLVPDAGLQPGITHPTPPVRSGWAMVVSGGLTTRANASLGDVAELDGALYLGTSVATGGPAPDGARSGAEIWRTTDGVHWERIVANGFADPANTQIGLVAFGGRLFAVTTNAREGMQVWVTEDGTTFTAVVTGGFGKEANAHAMPVVFHDRLILAIDNTRWGAQVWVSDDGTTYRRVVRYGMNEPSNIGFAHEPFGARVPGVVFDGRLYVGTVNPTAGGEIWRTADGVAWERVAAGGLGRAANEALMPQVVSDGRIYAISRSATGIDVFRSADGLAWDAIGAAGFRDRPDRNLSGRLVVHDGKLFLAMTNRDERIMSSSPPLEAALSRGFRLFLLTSNDRWVQIGRDGFGDPHNYAADVAIVGDALYLSATNFREGDSLWRSKDGMDWTLAFREGRATPFSMTLEPAVFADHLYLIHSDLGLGMTVWRQKAALGLATTAPPTSTAPSVPSATAAPARGAGIWLIVAAVVVGIGLLAALAMLRRPRRRPPGMRPGTPEPEEQEESPRRAA